MNYFITTMLIILIAGSLSYSQEFKPMVSKDSLAVLEARLEAVKANAKIQILKIKEASEEADVEKLRLKLLEAEGNAKASTLTNPEMKKKMESLDAKSIEKLEKKAKNDVADAQKALERYNKQVEKVETLRKEIIAEERKISFKKPQLIFSNN